MEKEAKPVIIANYAEYHCTKKNASPDSEALFKFVK